MGPADLTGDYQDVINPSTNMPIGKLGHALKGRSRQGRSPLRRSGFNTWRRVSAFERSKILREPQPIWCDSARLSRSPPFFTFEQSAKLLADEAKPSVS